MADETHCHASFYRTDQAEIFDKICELDLRDLFELRPPSPNGVCILCANDPQGVFYIALNCFDAGQSHLEIITLEHIDCGAGLLGITVYLQRIGVPMYEIKNILRFMERVYSVELLY